MFTIKGPLVRLILTVAHLFKGTSRSQAQGPLAS